jgi:hypothetical protein
MMVIPIDDRLFTICGKIVDENLTEDEWSKVESDDIFQDAHYVGGFDGTESAFCFAYTDENNAEFWFQLTLSEVKDICAKRMSFVRVRPPHL